MKVKNLIFIVLSFFVFISPSLAQRKKEKIKLIDSGGGAMERVKKDGKSKDGEARYKISGKRVIFQQGNTFYYCNEAYLIKKKNNDKIEGYGNVQIKSDSVNVTGDKLFYDGETKIAQLRGNVVLIDKTMTLYTDNLDYNTKAHTGNYFGGGRILDEGNTLKSKNGFYDKNGRYVIFTNDVDLLSQKREKLYTEYLHYHLETKIAQTKGKTKIIGTNGVESVSEDFTYDTRTKESTFIEQVGITEEYILKGDKNFNDDVKKTSRSENNVTLTIRKDSITVMGDRGTYDRVRGIAKVWGNVLVMNPMREDTMFLTADTLIALDNVDDSKDKLLAYNNVKIFKADLQGKCDSMVYNTGDSTIFLYTDPLLWSEGSQMRGDSIHLLLVNKRLDKLFMRDNSFIISEDSIKNYNQLKGKHMTGYFRDNSIKRVDVNGNGESIYFVLDKSDSILVGMNKVICSNMIIKFAEKNKISRVSFITTPDGAFIPPHEIEEPAKRLKGFKWRIEERPTRAEVVGTKRKNLVIFNSP